MTAEEAALAEVARRIEEEKEKARIRAKRRRRRERKKHGIFSNPLNDGQYEEAMIDLVSAAGAGEHEEAHAVDDYREQVLHFGASLDLGVEPTLEEGCQELRNPFFMAESQTIWCKHCKSLLREPDVLCRRCKCNPKVCAQYSVQESVTEANEIQVKSTSNKSTDGANTSLKRGFLINSDGKKEENHSKDLQHANSSNSTLHADHCQGSLSARQDDGVGAASSSNLNMSRQRDHGARKKRQGHCHRCREQTSCSQFLCVIRGYQGLV